MKRNIMAIIEKDSQYARLLVTYLKEHMTISITPAIFTDYDSFQRASLEMEIKMILVDDALFSKDLVERYEHIILLVSSKDIHNKNCLFKYQALHNICEYIESYYKQKIFSMPLLVKEDKRTRIMGIFTLNDNVAAELISFGIAAEYGKNHKVLLVNMELFSGVCYGQSSSESVSDLIYKLKHSPVTSEDVRACIVDGERFDYICPVNYYADLYELTASEFSLLLKGVMGLKEYTIIILLFDFLHQIAPEIVMNCNQLYLVQNTETNDNRVKNFIRMTGLDKKIDEEKKIFFLPTIKDCYRYGINENLSNHQLPFYEELLYGISDIFFIVKSEV